MEPTAPPRAKAPPNACDCHAHVFGNADRYPFSAARGYTPPPASLAEYRAMLDVLGIDRAVIVQPSVYGTDNACTREAVEELGAKGRGVAVIDERTGDAEIAALHDAGFRGIRFNIVSKGGVSFAALETLAARIADLGWHIQIFAQGQTLAEAADRLRQLPVDIVLDHIANADPGQGPDQSGFRATLDLLATGRCWVKLSGAYRVDRAGPPWSGATPFARALIETAPDRLVWGTDWPHPDVKGPMPNDGALFDVLLDWAPIPEVLRQILVDNPARLYDFRPNSGTGS